MINPSMDELRPPTRADAHAGPFLRESARVPRDGHANRRARGPLVHGIYGRRSGVDAPNFSDPEQHDFPDFRFRDRRNRNRHGQRAGTRRRGHRLRQRHVFQSHGGNRRAHWRQNSPRTRAVGPDCGPGRRAPRRARPQNQIRGAGAWRNFHRGAQQTRSVSQGCR